MKYSLLQCIHYAVVAHNPSGMHCISDQVVWGESLHYFNTPTSVHSSIRLGDYKNRQNSASRLRKISVFTHSSLHESVRGFSGGQKKTFFWCFSFPALLPLKVSSVRYYHHHIMSIHRYFSTSDVPKIKVRKIKRTD